MAAMNFDPVGYSPRYNPLGRRDCVECDQSASLTCPNCPSGQVCIQVSATCDVCASRKCVPLDQSGATVNAPPPPNKGPNVPAIAGGVVGGVIFAAILVGLVYWFYIRKRRQSIEATKLAYEPYSEKGSAGYGPSGARSQYSRHSTTSTIRTTGSNVIKIGFIPGVTDRSADSFTPPVPPIPSQPHSPFTDASGDHYFMPGDLRDSTYTGFTADSASSIHRHSMARSITPSLAPSISQSLLRQSFASTIYQEDAVANPMPAQTALRGRANVVSVKSSNPSRANSRTSSIPRVPTIDRDRYTETASVVTANTSPTGSHSHRGFSPAGPLSIPEEGSNPSIYISADDNDSVMTGDTMSVHSGHPNVKNAIQEATRRASKQPTHGGLGSVRPADPSPFSDLHRLSEAESTTSN